MGLTVAAPKATGHSDCQKFCDDLNLTRRLRFVRIYYENIGKVGDFQAEYEGSIPFTRSNPSRLLGEGRILF